MASVADLLSAAQAAERDLYSAREKAIEWFRKRDSRQRLLSEETRHAELITIVALLSEVHLSNSRWWQAYQAYREQVDAENKQRDEERARESIQREQRYAIESQGREAQANRINFALALITVLLAAATFWQCYEAHRQTKAMQDAARQSVSTFKPPIVNVTVPSPAPAPAPVVTVIIAAPSAMRLAPQNRVLDKSAE
jgi:hypothetical protein